MSEETLSFSGTSSDYERRQYRRIMREMKKETIKKEKEDSGFFKNHISDIAVLVGINGLLSILFFVAYYEPSWSRQNDQSKSSQKCVDLLHCSQVAAYFHLIDGVLYLILIFISYLFAKLANPAYYDCSKTTMIWFTATSLFSFIALIIYSVICIFRQEPCGALKHIFITYGIASVCLIIAVSFIFVVAKIKDTNESESLEEDSQHPIHTVRKSIKYQGI